jgi:hypothetical protein
MFEYRLEVVSVARKHHKPNLTYSVGSRVLVSHQSLTEISPLSLTACDLVNSENRPEVVSVTRWRIGLGLTSPIDSQISISY